MRICRTLFSVFLAAAFFPDERNALKNRLFQSGLLPAFIGMILTIMGSQDFGHVEFNLGVLGGLAAYSMNRFPLSLVSLPKNPVIPGGFFAGVKNNQPALGAAHLVHVTG